MTVIQEDALYEFLENVTEPFSMEDMLAYIKTIDTRKTGSLALELAACIDSRNIAFRLGANRWVSRRGCFEPALFVISPTRLELLNGILIPGHRCVPFANPVLLPQELTFSWKGREIPWTTTEGEPEDFYPYYCIFGEEYAPQYVARDNPKNEAAYNADPYEDPPEVSVHTLDMRNVYRESGFVPGDRFVVRTVDWKTGAFSLERAGKDEWPKAELDGWFKAAEGGFEDSFTLLGPGASTEEQIAYAYWYGGKRIREVPAYSLEEFLYEKTDHIEIAAYGIETRFWYSGKDIPDSRELEGSQLRPDQTLIEEILCREHIPISEFVIQSYVRDALFRNDSDIMRIIERIVPPPLELDEDDGEILAQYIADVLEEFQQGYSLFSDQGMGPIRQRVGELHTAVIELAARLRKAGLDPSSLPKHTFIVLSQIQGHAAGAMEDLDIDEAPAEEELEALDNSLDSMIETYEEVKNLIDEAMNSFRRNKLSVVKGPRAETAGRIVQISIGGTSIWRRIILPETLILEKLHGIIQTLFGWGNTQPHQFNIEKFQKHEKPHVSSAKLLDFPGKEPSTEPDIRLEQLVEKGIMELFYEYGNRWTIKIIFLSRYEGEDAGQIRCVAGAEASPPEHIEGPLRFRKFLSALERGTEAERQEAREKLGRDFDPEFFDLEACNRRLNSGVPSRKTGPVILEF